MKLLFIDTETGGINEQENSLLSIGLGYWNNGVIVDELELYIKEEKYNVTEKAMEINKLNLEEVYLKGVTHYEATKQINKFIKNNFQQEKAIVCGHNVGFDIRFLKELYKKSNMNYEENISYRSVDTASIIQFMSIADKFDGKNLKSLDDVIDYFNISNDGRHTALGDTKKTIDVFNKLLKII